MAEKERVKRKQKSVKSTEITRDSSSVQDELEIEEESHQVEDEGSIIKEFPSSVVEDQRSDSESTVEAEQFLPTWGDIVQTEWMYHIPVREEDIEMWSSEWADFVLQWCEEFSVHILSFSKFVSELPFKDIQNKADAYRLIGDKLVEKEVGIWMEGKKRQLRVFWRFLEEWADIVYAWALDNGQTRLDVKSIVIQESTQAFAKLPEKEIRFVLKMLVERELAEWIDRQKGAIRILT